MTNIHGKPIDDSAFLDYVLRHLGTKADLSCPECHEDVAYEPEHDDEPDVGLYYWPGGYGCQCGWTAAETDDGVDIRSSKERRPYKKRYHGRTPREDW